MLFLVLIQKEKLSWQRIIIPNLICSVLSILDRKKTKQNKQTNLLPFSRNAWLNARVLKGTKAVWCFDPDPLKIRNNEVFAVFISK